MKENINLATMALVCKKDINLKKEILKIRKILNFFDIKLLIEEKTATFFNLEKSSKTEILKNTNMIISLGGDGTLISCAREFKDCYIVGVYAGNLGFLTDIKIDDFKKFILDLKQDKFKIINPFMLEVSFDTFDNKSFKKIAFNDVVFTRPNHMIKLNAYLNDTFFNTYIGDGIIISTPMGSTAYNLSAFGPIIYPACDVLVLTPICSHSLTQRPLILPRKDKIKISSSDDGISILIDGQDSYNFNDFKSVRIGINSNKAKLIKSLDYDYFAVLKEKLKWGHIS